MLREIAQSRRTRRALGTLPLGQADVAAIGHHSDYIEDILAYDARNPGTGEARATAVTLRPADQEVYHDRAHPSAIILPVRQAR
jgi:hypothetical protein